MSTTDYDGDGLSAIQEHVLWRYVGPATLPLAYSAGLKRTVAGPVDDDYRDADVDGLGNWDEFNGPMTPAWWVAKFKTEIPYTEPYAGTSAIDPDSDGDTLIDGADDQDHDLWPNVAELARDTHWVQPFNPCLPDYDSPTCSNHPPIDNSYPPFNLPDPLPPAPIVLPQPLVPDAPSVAGELSSPRHGGVQLPERPGAWPRRWSACGTSSRIRRLPGLVAGRAQGDRARAGGGGPRRRRHAVPPGVAQQAALLAGVRLARDARRGAAPARRAGRAASSRARASGGCSKVPPAPSRSTTGTSRRPAPG